MMDQLIVVFSASLDHPFGHVVHPPGASTAALPRTKCSEVRFTFTHDLHWYNTIDDQELLDKQVVEFIENGGGLASPEIMQSFIEQEGLCGYELQISPSGFLSMVCYSKFGNTEYFSENSIVFYDLLPALTIQSIKDEITERVIRPLYKAFTLMEME